jgi:hypothetical protein
MHRYGQHAASGVDDCGPWSGSSSKPLRTPPGHAKSVVSLTLQERFCHVAKILQRAATGRDAITREPGRLIIDLFKLG